MAGSVSTTVISTVSGSSMPTGRSSYISILSLMFGIRYGHGVAEHLVGKADLLVGLVVHEVVHVAVLVQELHLRVVQDGALDHVHRAEAVLADGAVLEVRILACTRPRRLPGVLCWASTTR